MLNDGEEDAERVVGANGAVGLLSPGIVETVILPEPIARLFLATLASGFVAGFFIPVFLSLRSSLGAIVWGPARAVAARLFLAALASGFVAGLFAPVFDQLESGQ